MTHRLDIRAEDSVHCYDIDYHGPDIAIARVGRETWGTHFRHTSRPPKHYRSCFLVMTGHGRLRWRGNEHELQPGTLFRLGTPWWGSEVAVTGSTNMRIAVVTYAGRRAWVFDRQHLGTKQQVLQPGNSAALVDCFDHCYAVVRDQGPLTQELALLQLQALLRSLRAGLSLPRIERSGARETWQHCRRQIEREHASIHDLRDVARQAGIDPAYLSRLFRRFSGTTAAGHLQLVRLQRCAWLLLTTDRSLAAIADAVGYGSAAGLSRAFKELYGLSPQAYRERDRR